MHGEKERHAEVRAAFARWASLQPKAPQDASVLVQSVEESELHAGLLSTDAPLCEGSYRSFVCDHCNGEKNVRCSICGGSGRIRCDACGGQRKIHGYAANGAYRLLKCSTCRGKGEVDCGPCRRGILPCAGCEGEGHVLRWAERETGRRVIPTTHPPWIARHLGWGEHAADTEVARDGTIVAKVERPRALTADDLGNVPPLWLHHLSPTLHRGENVVRQCLRIARIPQFSVRYRLGGDEDSITFTGHRLIASYAGPSNPFARRASRLQSLKWVLATILVIATIGAVARGAFYWSVPTFLGVAALAGSLTAIYGAAREWTCARQRMRLWLAAMVVFLAITVGFAFAAAPRIGHAERLLSSRNLDAAERELRALGVDASPHLWTELRRARASALYIPTARDALDRRDWVRAADAIAAARGAGVATASLEGALRTAGVEAVARAARESNARERLHLRLAAEAMIVAWERASGNWGTPALISLRTEMARDVAIIEKSGRRRKRK